MHNCYSIIWQLLDQFWNMQSASLTW